MRVFICLTWNFPIKKKMLLFLGFPKSDLTGLHMIFTCII